MQINYDYHLSDMLEKVVVETGIIIRNEKINIDDSLTASNGGLCWINKQKVIFVDTRISVNQKCYVLINALKKCDLSKVFVPPVIRLLIEHK